MKRLQHFSISLLIALAAGCSFGATVKTSTKLSDPTPGDPLTVTMGERKPVRIRVARNQATLIRLPDGQRVMNVYGGDKGEGGVWSVDAGKVPTRFLAVKPKETGIHTTLHVISNTGQEISFFLQEVTGIDSQFDAEVDAESADTANASSVETPEVKWVPAEEVISCKTHADTLKLDVAEAANKAQQKAEAAVAEYRGKLFFGYRWDVKKAQRLGLEAAFSDDKFTYFRGSKVLALYEVNEDGKPSLIQYSYSNGLYTVPKVLYDGYFAIGTKKENKVAFHRERADQTLVSQK